MTAVNVSVTSSPANARAPLSISYKTAASDAASLERTLMRELRHWCRVEPQYSLHMADVHALLGKSDEAFWWLERVLAVGACPYPFLASNDPLLASLRDAARGPAFTARVRDAWQR
ncbi:MAG: hypothetical protein ACT4QD_08290 [Acidobacteriota bacterium]